MIKLKTFYIVSIFSIIYCSSFAQKQTFDIVSYTAPAGWAETPGSSNISYSRIENGNWAQMAIYRSTESTGAIASDFDKEWNELVATSKTISSLQKTTAQAQNDWHIMKGSGTWQYNGATVTSQLTVYSNNKMYVSVLCNFTTAVFAKEYEALLASLSLNAEAVKVNDESNNNSSTTVANKNSVVGLWVIRQRESTGAGKYSTYTGGYMRKEYQFNKDGTYLFKIKNWLAANETIYFISETGTWSAKGDQLTLTPKKGKGGWWNKDKVTNNVDKWGSFKKAADYKLQTITYRFEIKEDSYYGNSIVLYSNKPTERDGGEFNQPPYRFSYTVPQDVKPWIDNPPGWKF